MSDIVYEIDYAEVASRVNPDYTAEEVRGDLMWHIEDAIRSRPRSQQRVIGPSEIGHECGRWVGYKLIDSPDLNAFAANRDQWRTQIGTAVHTWLADTFYAANDPDHPIFLVEHSLNVGRLHPIGDGEPIDIYGSGDLYTQGWVVDWKIVGPGTLKKVKAVSRVTGKPHGASRRYRVQGNTYGLGWAKLGLPVKGVIIAFLPAAGDLRSDAFWWNDTFDPAMAEEALTRLNGTNALMRSGLPIDQALAVLPTAESYCAACPYYNSAADRLSEGCPGGPKTSQRVDQLDLLVGQ